MEKTIVPAIRFDGFDGEWEAARLGDHGRAVSGVGFPERHQGGQIGVPFFKVSDMNSPGNESHMSSAMNYVTNEQVTEMRWPVIKQPAVFFAKVGAAVLKNRKRMVQPPFLMDNNTMAYLFDKNYWDSKFVLWRFNQIDLTKLVQVGALPSYNAGQVEDIEAFVPSTPEQQAIGSFFSYLDTFLDAGEKKLQKLRALKQTMLTKMFPQGDSRVPEIRFESFESEWTEQPFNETFQFGRSVVLSRADLNDEGGDGKSVHYGDILTKFGYMIDTSVDDLPFITDSSVVAKNLRSKLSNGDVIMADTAEDDSVGRCVEIRVNSGVPVFAGLHTHALRPLNAFAEGFIGVLMNSPTIHDQIVHLSQGTKVTSVSKDALNSLLLLVPSESEQEVISAYFRELDVLLDAESQKLEKLRHLKSAFLSSMFV